MKKKIGNTIVTLFIILLLIIIGLLWFQKYTTGDIKEREKILSATMWELQKEGYSQKDIFKIRVDYNWEKGGRLPYQVMVIFKKDKANYIDYGWNDVNQKYIEKYSSEASEYNKDGTLYHQK
ncbi:DUF3139 domain-containing protein [Terrilactibacillus laevilacticus]|uniref:DUF3139 domain-containing protein n=1 Tax=Terrilactibacillus laevilacticus TaxID=1380157 RepID=A0ABW5PUJ0_9BACI|nr:DUF3139 domain-containing protein [Terrilactibacillus laevilacticus]